MLATSLFKYEYFNMYIYFFFLAMFDSGFGRIFVWLDHLSKHSTWIFLIMEWSQLLLYYLTNNYTYFDHNSLLCIFH